MNTNFPTVRIRYRLEMEGALSEGQLQFPADEWAELDEPGRHDAVRSAAIAARVKTTWAVEGAGVSALPRRVSIEPSSN